MSIRRETQGLGRHFDHVGIECLHRVFDGFEICLKYLLRQVRGGVGEAYVFVNKFDGLDQVLGESELEFLIAL